MDKDIKDPSQDIELPPSLRFLQKLVTVLTVTMIGGVLIIIALLVIRLNDDAVSLPASVTLPNGTIPVAFTQTKDWYAVVTEDNRILIFDLNGELSQTLDVTTQN